MDQQLELSSSSEFLQGTVERLIFCSHDTGFTVCTLATSHLGPITITGILPQLAVGQEVRLTGVWRTHKKFGRQFEAQQCVPILPTTTQGVQKYLGSGLIKGIGSSYAQRLVAHFGTNILTIIDEQPHRLHEVPGIGEKRIEQIVSAWKNQKDIANIMIFLQEKGISPAYATKIYRHYHHRAIDILQENPYRLADDVWGIGFKIADSIAQKLGVTPHAPARIQAGIVYALSQATKRGHLYLHTDELEKETYTLLNLNEFEHTALVQAALTVLYEQQKTVAIKTNDGCFITLVPFYNSEIGTAKQLHALMATPSPLTINATLLETILQKPQTAQLMLNEEQKQGIRSCLQHKVTIITGGPGTGKTTILSHLLAILEEQHITYKLAAPTARAAKRITEGTRRYATTIHRLLEYAPASTDTSAKTFKYHEKNPLKTDFIIIDEASMVDIFLANALLRAIPLSAHLVLLGDVDQLPPVGAGNFLNDCIASSIIPVIRLTEIFRQAHDSLIILNAHRINQGEFPFYKSTDPLADFLFIREENAELFETRLRQVLFTEPIKRGITPEEVALLCPMNRGGTGTFHLNVILQGIFNPHQTDSLSHAGITYKVNDKVMQIRNNYEKTIFNGDIGTLHAINREEQTFTVNFDEQMITYEFDEIDELALAYAMTIHKSQGSEYPAVIIPLFTHHFTLLQRNLIYTAVTRAKKLCIFIGQIKALAIALKNVRGTQRTTFLRQLLQNSQGIIE